MSKKQTTSTGTMGTSSTADSSPTVQRFKNEEPDVCCICLDELPTDTSKLCRYTCCGKTCCLECHFNVMKSKMPDNLKNRCHQCRKPTPTAQEAVERLREWVEKGEAWAQTMMAGWYRDGEHGLQQSYVMACMLFEKAVAQGDPDAMYNLALLYRDGQGVEQSVEKEIELYTLAAEQGYAKALFNLGCIYRDGQGVVQSFEKAVELFTMVSEQGHVKAMYNLAFLYRDGQGVVQSFKKAAELYTKAAEQGHVDAMCMLGGLYFQGQGVAQSNELAREWLIKAADEGNENAIKILKILDEQKTTTTTTSTATTTTTTTTSSRCCASCTTPQTKDQKLNRCKCHSVHYCNSTCQRAHWGTHQEEHRRLVQEKKASKNASDNDKKETSTRTTTSSTLPPQPKKELDNNKKETTTKPSSSSPQQQNEEPDVCCICLDELPTDVTKLTRATCCGKQWHIGCQNNVMKSTMPDELKGRCHQCRKPIPITDKGQIEQLREWVDKGEAWAQLMMAEWYYHGEYGLKQSYVMAAMLFEKAVAQGDPNAMYNLAILYENGQGIEQSDEKTVELCTMSAEQGNVDAMCNLGRLYLKGQGVAQSNELSREWLTKAANEGEETAIKALKLLDELEGKPTTAPPTATAPPPPICCSSCNNPQPSGHTFRKCTGCRTVQYCNKECQRAHWSPGGHKQECND